MKKLRIFVFLISILVFGQMSISAQAQTDCSISTRGEINSRWSADTEDDDNLEQISGTYESVGYFQSTDGYDWYVLPVYVEDPSAPVQIPDRLTLRYVRQDVVTVTGECLHLQTVFVQFEQVYVICHEHQCGYIPTVEINPEEIVDFCLMDFDFESCNIEYTPPCDYEPIFAYGEHNDGMFRVKYWTCTDFSLIEIPSIDAFRLVNVKRMSECYIGEENVLCHSAIYATRWYHFQGSLEDMFTITFWHRETNVYVMPTEIETSRNWQEILGVEGSPYFSDACYDLTTATREGPNLVCYREDETVELTNLSPREDRNISVWFALNGFGFYMVIVEDLDDDPRESNIFLTESPVREFSSCELTDEADSVLFAEDATYVYVMSNNPYQDCTDNGRTLEEILFGIPNKKMHQR